MGVAAMQQRRLNLVSFELCTPAGGCVSPIRADSSWSSGRGRKGRRPRGRFGYRSVYLYIPHVAVNGGPFHSWSDTPLPCCVSRRAFLRSHSMMQMRSAGAPLIPNHHASKILPLPPVLQRGLDYHRTTSASRVASLPAHEAEGIARGESNDQARPSRFVNDGIAWLVGGDCWTSRRGHREQGQRWVAASATMDPAEHSCRDYTLGPSRLSRAHERADFAWPRRREPVCARAILV